jgi:hypothetical protein
MKRNMTKVHKSNNKPSGKFIAAPPKPLINPGDYHATIVDWQLHRQFNSPKILLQFEVRVDDEFIVLTHFTNIKTDEAGRMMEPSATMKIAKTLNNLFPDTEFDNIDLDELHGMRCIVSVRTVTKDSRKKDKPPSKFYSAIDEIFLDAEAEKDPWA